MFFGKDSINYRYEALMMLDEYEKNFAEKLNLTDSEELSNVFSAVRILLLSITPSQFETSYKDMKISLDHAVLNMICTSATQAAMNRGIDGRMNAVNRVYDRANELKYSKGYIDSAQKEENKKVYLAAAFGVPYLGAPNRHSESSTGFDKSVDSKKIEEKGTDDFIIDQDNNISPQFTSVADNADYSSVKGQEESVNEEKQSVTSKLGQMGETPEQIDDIIITTGEYSNINISSSDNANVNIRSKMNKKLIISMISVCAIVLLAIGGYFVYSAFINSDSWDMSTGLEPAYSNYYGTTRNTSQYDTIEEVLNLELVGGMYIHLMENDILDAGIYQVNEDSLTLKEYDGTLHYYTIDFGKYIIRSTSYPVGRVPAKKRFNENVKDTNEHYIMFYDDGSAIYDGEKVKYDREGYTINFTFDDNRPTITCYVINGYVCSEVFLSGNVSNYAHNLADYAILHYKAIDEESMYEKALMKNKKKEFEKQYPIDSELIRFKEY